MTNQKIMQHMRGNNSYMNYCWADPVVHLLLLQSPSSIRSDRKRLFWPEIKIVDLTDGNSGRENMIRDRKIMIKH